MESKTFFLTPGCIAFTLAFIVCSCRDTGSTTVPISTTVTSPTSKPADKEEIFYFSSNGKTMGGKIFIPGEYETKKDLPVIYLIDFTEQHYKVATDEFYKVIEGVKGVIGLNVLVVTLSEHLDVDLKLPGDFQKYSTLYKDMASYVDDHYKSNTSRTFIGRGSEAGQVLMTLFLEEKETSIFQNFIATDTPDPGPITLMIKNGKFPQEKGNKKLHYSFSSDNNYDHSIKLIKVINEQAYPWLKFKSIEYSYFSYESAYPTAYAEGIRFIFQE